MTRNVLIKEVAKYLPPTVVNNDYYIKHFNQRNIKSRGLYEAVGRDKRHIVKNNEENTYTMGLEAAKTLLAQSDISIEDIDMLVFVSDSPEFLAPTTALTLRENLGAINAHMVFDMNQNCTGMVAGLDVVAQYLKTKKYLNKALVVSSFYGSLMAEKDSDPVSHGCLSDGASAVLLEVEETDIERGIIDSSYLTNSETCNLMVFPAAGLSKLHEPSVPMKDKKMYYGYEEADFLGHDTITGLTKLLKQNDLSPDHINHYLVSQFESAIIDEVAEAFNQPKEKFVTTMADLGYVGNSSPIFAFEKLVQNGVTDGDLAVVSSVGAGYIVSSILYKF